MWPEHPAWEGRRTIAQASQLGSRPPSCHPVQVAKLESVAQYHLYLVDWGYNTAEERQRAAANDRIEVVDIKRFAELAGSSQ